MDGQSLTVLDEVSRSAPAHDLLVQGALRQLLRGPNPPVPAESDKEPAEHTDFAG